VNLSWFNEEALHFIRLTFLRNAMYENDSRVRYNVADQVICSFYSFSNIFTVLSLIRYACGLIDAKLLNFKALVISVLFLVSRNDD